MADLSGDRGSDRRLNSWKEIATFLGRDLRTVKRWEASRGLPVRRVPGGPRTTVFAYVRELDAWLGGAPTAPAEAPLAGTATGAVAPVRRQGVPHLALTAVAALLLGLSATALLPGVWPLAQPATTPANAAYVPSARVQDLYLEGVYLWEKRTADSLRAAVLVLRQAIALEPDYAPAHAGLANTYNLLREYSLMPAAEAYGAAAAEGRRAVALDPGDADAQSALAFAEFYGLRQLPEGIARFELARGLDPNSAKIRHWLGNALLHLGRFDEALAEIETAQRLDPTSRAVLSSKGLALFCSGRVEEALTLLNEMAKREPDFLSPHTYLTYVHLARGDYAAYLAELRTAGALREDPSRLAVAEAGERGFATGGFGGMVAEMLAEERRRAEAGGTIIYNVARLEALAGDWQSALASLRASLAADEEFIMALNIDPAFRLIRTNSEFRAFAAGFGLPIVQ